jgi:hypothetical protein
MTYCDECGWHIDMSGICADCEEWSEETKTVKAGIGLTEGLFL